MNCGSEIKRIEDVWEVCVGKSLSGLVVIKG
jgi:hypothetical protein